jgi:hypothetical protein
VAEFTRQMDDHGNETIRKDGEIIANVIPCATGHGLWLHYFGDPNMGAFAPGSLCLCTDWGSVRETVKAAAAA